LPLTPLPITILGPSDITIFEPVTEEKKARKQIVELGHAYMIERESTLLDSAQEYRFTGRLYQTLRKTYIVNAMIFINDTTKSAESWLEMVKSILAEFSLECVGSPFRIPFEFCLHRPGKDRFC